MNFYFHPAHPENYASGRIWPIRYIVVHYTANKGDTARNNLDYFSRTVTGTSAHYFVDENEVCQSVREEDTAWHCGSSHPIHPECRNHNSIGVEMCNSLNGVPEATKERTAALVRELMDQYDIPADHVLRHFDVTGKKCPAPWVDCPEEWDAFQTSLEEKDLTEEQVRTIIRDEYAKIEAERAARPASGWAKPYIQQVIEASLMSGADGSIDRPQAFATREELATVAAAWTNSRNS